MPEPNRDPPNRAALKRIVTVVLGVASWGAVLFASAGRIGWLRGWIFLALYIGGLLAAFVVMRIANPELIAARGTKHANTKPFDRIFGAIYTALMLALPWWPAWMRCGSAGLAWVRSRFTPLRFSSWEPFPRSDPWR